MTLPRALWSLCRVSRGRGNCPPAPPPSPRARYSLALSIHLARPHQKCTSKMLQPCSSSLPTVCCTNRPLDSSAAWSISYCAGTVAFLRPRATTCAKLCPENYWNLGDVESNFTELCKLCVYSRFQRSQILSYYINLCFNTIKICPLETWNWTSIHLHYLVSRHSNSFCDGAV